METKQLIEEIIDIEWDMFQHVDNMGGRASCQDDFETFYIMRYGQYSSWSPEMVAYYHQYAASCQASHRNLISEKYARMMQYTDLHYYNKHLVHKLPKTALIKYRYINRIVTAMIEWELEFIEKYPKLGNTGRPVTSDGDKTGFTSLETYARGELETYPRELLEMYAAYVDQLKAEGKSLSLMIQDAVVMLYGYESIEEAEASL